MKSLQTLLQNVSFQKIIGKENPEIVQVTMDSRQVETNYLFVALRGETSDGHKFIPSAIEKGATVIILEDEPETILENVSYVLTDNTAKVLGQICANFYNNPSQKLKLVGITGTNGKTTTTTLLYNLFQKLGYKTGLISTVENRIGDKVIPTKFTTPYPPDLQALLAEMLKQGVTHCFMEVSSHAVVQERIAGLHFAGAAFTNISHDHLDYHKTFQEYIKAKKKFFDDLPKTAFALTNIDDKNGRIMLQNTKSQNQKTFGLWQDADYKAKILESSLLGLLLEINGTQSWFQLIGDFNAYNLTTVFAIADLLGEEKEEILTTLSGLRAVVGRFEQIPTQQGFVGIVDYAHTPDALENVLRTIQDLAESHQQITTVVGCGGNRDALKRPKMARIACEYSNKIILTSDNPRFENPEKILEDMQTGILPEKSVDTQVISDRREAIKTACQMATKHDIILIAGKGHENYQEIEGVRYPFDDKEVFKELAQELEIR